MCFHAPLSLNTQCPLPNFQQPAPALLALPGPTLRHTACPPRPGISTWTSAVRGAAWQSSSTCSSACCSQFQGPPAAKAQKPTVLTGFHHLLIADPHLAVYTSWNAHLHICLWDHLNQQSSARAPSGSLSPGTRDMCQGLQTLLSVPRKDRGDATGF